MDILVSKNEISDLMKTDAQENGKMSQHWKMLISSFTSQNGTLITPLVILSSELGLVCTKRHRFVEYTPKKCFNSFVKSTVDAKRQRDDNLSSSAVAETMNLRAKTSSGYEIMGRSPNTVTKYLNDAKTHAVIYSKLFTVLNHVNKALHEVEFCEAEIQHQNNNQCRVFHPSIRKTP